MTSPDDLEKIKREAWEVFMSVSTRPVGNSEAVYAIIDHLHERGLLARYGQMKNIFPNPPPVLTELRFDSDCIINGHEVKAGRRIAITPNSPWEIAAAPDQFRDATKMVYGKGDE